MKIILILLLTINSLIAQVSTFWCEQRFEGTINSDSITWQPSETIENTILRINNNKQTIQIENDKYSFKIIDTISKTDNELTYYAKDWENLKCYIIIESFKDWKYIYFQYNNLVFGYKIKLI